MATFYYKWYHKVPPCNKGLKELCTLLRRIIDYCLYFHNPVFWNNTSVLEWMMKAEVDLNVWPWTVTRFVMKSRYTYFRSVENGLPSSWSTEKGWIVVKKQIFTVIKSTKYVHGTGFGNPPSRNSTPEERCVSPVNKSRDISHCYSTGIPSNCVSRIARVSQKYENSTCSAILLWHTFRCTPS